MKEYETIKGLALRIGASERTVRRRLEEMRPYIGSRYPEAALITDGKFVRIRVEDYCDFINHRKEVTA